VTRVSQAESRGASVQIIGNQGRFGGPRDRRQGRGGREIRSAYSIPGALANQQKYTGPRTQGGEDLKDENQKNPEAVAEGTNQKKNNMYKRKT